MRRRAAGVLTALALGCTTSLALAGATEEGVAALKAGEPEQARVLLAEATESDPSDVRAWWELGWAHWVLGDYAAASDCWTRVKELDPEHAEVDTWLPQATERARLATLSTAPGEIPLEPSARRFTLAAAGDTMMGTDLRRGPSGLAPDDGAELFEGVDSVLRGADLSFVNLEGPLADGLPQTKCGPQAKSCYAFRTPTRYVKALVDAGVDLASLANNHSMDLGPKGMEQSMATLDAAGIAHAGPVGDVAIVELDGLKVGMVAAHSGSCCLNVNRPQEVAAAIAELDRQVDVVILSFHGGAEGAAHRHVPGEVEIGYGEKRGDVQDLAHTAVDAGADLVLGHGPHVLRGMEVYKGRMIAYSLGNFCGYKQFGTQGGYGGTSVILEVELADNGVLTAAKLHPVALDSQGRPRLDPTGAAWAQIQELSRADFPQTGVRVGEDGALSW